MRLIDADELEQEVIKRAFEGKLEWSVNELKQLIRKQCDAPEHKIKSACERKGIKVRW